MIDELTDDEILADMAENAVRPLVHELQARQNENRAAMRTLHTEAHGLAKDISEWCGEPKKFARYLGRIKACGLQRAYTIFSELKQSRNVIRNRASLFMSKTKKK